MPKESHPFGHLLRRVLRDLPLWTGIAVVVLGVVVVIGWFTHWAAVIQMLPHLAPMKFNSALGIIFCGLSLILLTRGCEKNAAWLGAMAAALGLFTLVEYFTGMDFRIDELFVRDYILKVTSYPGRMSPLAAACFLFLGIGFVLVAMRRGRPGPLTIAGLLACIVVVVACVALFGYAMGIEAAYGWGAYTRMALHTALAFLALSMGLLSWAWQTTLRTDFNFLRWLPVTASLTLMVMIAFVSGVSFAQLRGATSWWRHSDQVLVKTQVLLGNIFATQRGVRNFVLTTQPVHLEVYNEGARKVPQQFGMLMLLTRDNPSQQKRLQTLATDLREFLEYSHELVETRRTNGLQAAIQLESNGRDVTIVKQTIDHLEDFANEENHLLDMRASRVDEDFHNTGRLLVFGSVLAAGLLMFSNGMASREMNRRRRAEQMQACLAAEIKNLIESSGEGIYGIDVHGKCTFINAAGARLIGYDVYNVLGQDMHQLIHHTRGDGSKYPLEECPIFLAFKSDLSCRVDSEVFWRKDGSSFMVEYTSFPIVEDSVIKGAVVTFSDISDRKRHEAEREKLIAELKQALIEVKTLSGLIPLCGWCKKVRSDTGYWQNVEQYIRSRTDATFSHGICPDCSKKMKADIVRVNTPGNSSPEQKS